MSRLSDMLSRSLLSELLSRERFVNTIRLFSSVTSHWSALLLRKQPNLKHIFPLKGFIFIVYMSLDTKSHGEDNKMDTKWTVIGISGCTNGGKTTLATALANHFPASIVVNQDTYFRSDDSKEHIVIPELNHKNWERLEAVDWDAMMAHMEKIMHSPPLNNNSLLIVEGHIIFNHPKLRNLFHKRYFLTLDREECVRRRVQRVYDPPDIPGYFDKCVWPMYLLNLEDVKENCPGVKYFDGNSKKEKILEYVLNDILSIVDKK